MISTSALAAVYLNNSDVTAKLIDNGFVACWREYVAEQYHVLTAQLGVEVSFVSGQPFTGGGSAVKMFNHIEQTRTLPVSTDFNESELNGEQGNLLFRAAHDLSHYLCDLEHRDEGHRCNFALDGETRAFARQARHLLGLAGVDARHLMGRLLVQVAFSEVVLQAAVFYESGDFAEQKVVLAGLDTINAWLVQCGEPAL
jgi:hypothetical protein